MSDLSNQTSERVEAVAGDAIRIHAREAVLHVMHDHNGWPAPHMANDELLDLAEHAARCAVQAYLSRLSALSPATDAVQGEGWVLVPREPTKAMLDAFVSRALQVSVHGDGGWTAYARAQWAQMLAAVPASPNGTNSDD